MKRLFTIFVLVSTFIYSQVSFTTINPYPTINDTYVGWAPSADRYYTISQIGEVVYTTNGGSSWNVSQVDTGNGILRSTFFVNDLTGFAAGSIYRLFKTTNGGNSWTQLSAPDTTKYDIFFIDELTGWTVGFGGFIAKTTDGGASWFSQSNTAITSLTLYGVFALDANTVFVCGNDNLIIKSTNGGATWNPLNIGIAGLTDLREVKFFNPDTGFVVGERGRIIRTTDGGNTWAQVYQSATTSVFTWGIDFNSNGTGIAAGTELQALRSTDWGATWTPVTLPDAMTSYTKYSVSFGDENTVYISGTRGYFVKSTNAGVDWQNLGYRFTATALNDVSFANDSVGFVCGLSGLIAKTTNGGRTFNILNTGTTLEISEIVAVDENYVYAGCKQGNIIRSWDGGNTWTLYNSGLGTSMEFIAIDFVSPLTGFVAGTNGTVLKTTDAGVTWVQKSTGFTHLLWDMDFVDSLYGWISGTGERIIATTDGGETWNLQLSAGGLGTYGISFVNRLNGVAAGSSGNTFYTEDGGVTWTPAQTKPAQTVWGVHYTKEGDVFRAFAACASGYIYISDDGGKNWKLQPRQTINTFDDVWATNPNNAWFVGNLGTSIKYVSSDVIPVEGLVFSSVVSGNEILLNWQTLTETNNYGFEIQRQKDEREFLVAGFVPGKGNSTTVSNYSFTEKLNVPGKYNYRLKQIDNDGSFSYSSEIAVDILPGRFTLNQNYPNPFGASSKVSGSLSVISFVLGEEESVSLRIYDITGSLVDVLINSEKLPAGDHKIEISADKYPSGVYYYRLETERDSDTRKMLIIK